jgi:hypothetical protein
MHCLQHALRHCERSEAIQNTVKRSEVSGLLRFARNDAKRGLLDEGGFQTAPTNAKNLNLTENFKKHLLPLHQINKVLSILISKFYLKSGLHTYFLHDSNAMLRRIARFFVVMLAIGKFTPPLCASR